MVVLETATRVGSRFVFSAAIAALDECADYSELPVSGDFHNRDAGGYVCE